ncbi:hypothetical protein DI392_07955 [Vibrio albus]|uniref:Uncharacterized protein n=1 Tax=Vibrio albus TaxID=2200953 RepID=A0A2U3BBE6_9VIBR|nr:hypothetical protein [Vibrio albus]PWI34116.1 hypothetical protein DI392_07955 [Vibrio albus]
MNKSALAITCLLIFSSGSALAAKPEWAGKGKPDITQITTVSDAQQLDNDITAREEEIDLLIEQKKDKAKKNKNKKEMQKFEEEVEALEKERKELKESKEMLREKQSGLEKQKQKKAEQEHKELGKGSEKGQQKREENSKKWWKFWE